MAQGFLVASRSVAIIRPRLRTTHTVEVRRSNRTPFSEAAPDQ